MRGSSWRQIILASGISTVLVAPSFGGQSKESLIGAGLDKDCGDYGEMVSRHEGTWDKINQIGCVGAFQFCPATLVMYYTKTVLDFINDHHGQVVAWTSYEKNQWAAANKYGMVDALLGQSISYKSMDKGGPTKNRNIDESAILMACQFGCGKYGLLYNYVQHRKTDPKTACDAADVKDGNHVSVCTYLVDGAGYPVPCFTERASAVRQPVNDQSPAREQVVPGPGQVSSPACGTNSFGSQGPFEVVLGKYTLRFGSAADPSSVKRYLDALEAPK
jgi:hypothetical protein